MLTTRNTGSNYLAKVVKLQNVRPHPNADRLQLATADFNTIITGQDAKEGDLCIYFPLETQINCEFLSFTNSYSDATRNLDTEKKGFFNKQGRVKAVKLRQVPSEGYVIPVSTLTEWVRLTDVGFNITEDHVGTEFDTVPNVLLCEKFVPQHIREKGPATTKKKDKKQQFNRIIENQFHFHVDTAQLKKNVWRIQPEDIITVSYKLHGTSMVASKVLVNRNLPIRDKVARFFGAKVQESEYDLVYSSRKVIKNKYERKDTHQDWYKEDVWGVAAKQLEKSLEAGVSIYAEIVGYTPEGRAIQKGYDYGCKPGQFKIFVYRMTYTNQEGRVLEFTTSQIRNYCDRYGLDMVPVLYHGPASGYTPYVEDQDREESVEVWQTTLLNTLMDEHLEKDCNMCLCKVPAEGVVVTVERENFEAFKLKSFKFFERESKELDTGEVGMEA